MHLYEYSVIRFLPKVEREEFINIGVILFSKKINYLDILYHLNTDKLSLLAPGADLLFLESALQSFVDICNGSCKGGLIASLETADRFRWLTAVKSSSIQTSRPHTGFTLSPDQTLKKLFEELVL
jgi:Protein of unknown function (DUF3037).